MKKTLACWCLLIVASISIRAQSGVSPVTTVVRYVDTAPTGSCSLGAAPRFVKSGANIGKHYCCVAFTWTQCDVGSSGGSGDVLWSQIDQNGDGTINYCASSASSAYATNAGSASTASSASSATSAGNLYAPTQAVTYQTDDDMGAPATRLSCSYGLATAACQVRNATLTAGTGGTITATTAGSATNCTNATSATNCTNATNASNLSLSAGASYYVMMDPDGTGVNAASLLHEDGTNTIVDAKLVPNINAINDLGLPAYVWGNVYAKAVRLDQDADGTFGTLRENTTSHRMYFDIDNDATEDAGEQIGIAGPDGSVTEAMLKATNSPTDEYCLTYEITGGDYEWQTCGSGSGDMLKGTYDTDSDSTIDAADSLACTNCVDGTKIAVGSDAAGDVMYYNGTDYVRLAAPVDGVGSILQGGTTPAWVIPSVEASAPAEWAFTVKPPDGDTNNDGTVDTFRINPIGAHTDFNYDGTNNSAIVYLPNRDQWLLVSNSGKGKFLSGDLSTAVSTFTFNGSPDTESVAITSPNPTHFYVGLENNTASNLREYSIADAAVNGADISPTKTWALSTSWCSGSDNYMWEGLAFVPDPKYGPTYYRRIPPGYFIGECQDTADPGSGDVYKFTIDTNAAGTAQAPVEITHYSDPPCSVGSTGGFGIDYEWATGRLWWGHNNYVGISDVSLNCLSGRLTAAAPTPDIEGIAVGRGYLALTDDNDTTGHNVQRYASPAPYFTTQGPIQQNLLLTQHDTDCTGDQGSLFYDTTDAVWKACNANTGTPVSLNGSATETNTLTTMTGVADDQIPLGSTTNVGAYTTINDCTGTGKALTYVQASNAFGCNTITGSGTSYQSKAVTIVNPTSAEAMTWFYSTVAVTIDNVTCVRTGGTNIDVTIKYGTNRTDAGTDIVADQTVSSATAGDSLTVADSSVETGGKWIWFTTSGISGSVTELSCTMRYHE